ncbi:unnamed protein product [Paramecium primaurelia]|uniref:EF-hand domain-containing protein n=1 Tax=Paramecium primaurelia TaxID=5886 RepID=A0A8S1Q4K3_PARPR|nr:unnamed protein product [Paramecium primaurelia]
MINQTKTQLFEVFKKFDKDGNGYVESNELIEISRQMNEEITQDDVDRLMKVVDQNGDGKISFEEFWDWWQFGKNDKLEKLVFMKLKLMNMLKSINSEFTRYGVSLEQKYDSKLDHHYWAINYGDFQSHFKFDIKFRYKGSGVQEDIQQEVGFQQSESLQIVFIFRSMKPPLAREKLEQLWNEYKQKLQEKQDQFLLPIIENSLNIQFQDRKDSVAIAINVSHPLIDMTFQSGYLPYCEKLGQDVEIFSKYLFGIKNGITKLMKKDQIFIKFLLEGFIMEFKSHFNSDLSKKLAGVILASLGQQFAQKIAQQKGRKLQKEFLWPMLFKSSKFHLQFKNMEDVNKFLKAMGLEELAEDQPTARQLIDEIKADYQFQSIKNPQSDLHFIYRLFLILAEHFIAQGTININIPFAYLNIAFNLEGLKEVFDAVFDHDKQKQQKAH